MLDMDETSNAPPPAGLGIQAMSTAQHHSVVASTSSYPVSQNQSVHRKPAPKPQPTESPTTAAAAAAAAAPQYRRGSTPNPAAAVRRKPVGSVSQPRPPNFSTGGKIVAVGRQSGDSYSVASAVSSPRVSSQQRQHRSRTNSPRRHVRDLDGPPPSFYSPDIPQSPGHVPFHQLPPDQARDVLLGLDTASYSPSTLTHARRSDPPYSPIINRPRPTQKAQRSETMPGRTDLPGPIQISVNDHYGLEEPPTPSKQGMSKFSFFGWKGAGSSPINESSPTTISDRSTPAQSPNGTSLSSFPAPGKTLPHAIDTTRANSGGQGLFASGTTFPQAPPTPAMSTQLEEMEEELRDISAELAGSIRREMELEEQVERLQLDGPNALEKDKRTSDYYSDSGTSSVRDPDGSTNRADDLEKLKRRSEQEKAQMKLDLAQKLQDERGRRRKLEDHIKSLEDHVANLEQGAGRPAGSGRVQELEFALEDNRRRLSEEKKHKQNFEDLIVGLQNEIVQHKNERDNLRDEVVPALRAQVEGLEAESAEHQKLVYENARMQQELASLRSGQSFGSIAEEDGVPGNRTSGLYRSSSVMRSGKTLSRSNSVTNKVSESRESLADRVKDIEDQRDALHRALKSLLDRQRFQTREHEKRLKVLEEERDKALEASTPRRKGFETEVKDLRYEINELRRRADDAMEQKWQCEKGLGGLKKDLDRAEQETASLRSILVENEIVVPESSDAGVPELTLANSASLEKSFNDLSVARARAESLQNSVQFQQHENEGLKTQLQASTGRIDTLSSQVSVQLAQNAELRSRLALAIGTGEREQKVSTARINQLQDKLRELEDTVMSAQQASEDKVLAHEDDLLSMRQNNSPLLQRLRIPTIGTTGGADRAPNSPMSPMIRSPRIDKTSSGAGMSMSAALKTEALEKQVRELESALRDADLEMSEVVQRMNKAQIEVMELQSARDEAMIQTRALQSKIVKENGELGGLTKVFGR